MRVSEPTVGYTLLWIFPALWLAGSFGLPGMIWANVSINGLYWLSVALDDHHAITPAVVLVPMMIGAVTVTSCIASRRSTNQRILLSKQARLLEHSAERSHRQEEILTEVLDSVDFGVIRIRTDGSESMRNEAHARMQELLGQDDEDSQLYGSDGVTPLAVEQMPLARARRGELFEREHVWHGKPGSGRRALSVTSRALTDSEGMPAGGILVSQDITDEVTALRAREDLFASVSHELRTPLTSILGYLELVLDMSDLPPRARRGLDIAERNATRLLAMIADILTAADHAQDGVELSIIRENARIDEIVDAAIEAITARADERGMVLDTDAVERVSAFIDPARMRQVIDNLLSNAVKYGAERGRIEIGVTQNRDHVMLVVRDDGPGISAEEIPRLFDRFFRADAVRRTSTHGSGLGLSISRNIVRAHGGEITVKSAPGDGAAFVVRLPLHANERAAE
jgi:signal transduction histidine kinase